VVDGLQMTGLPRRSLLKRSLGLSVGALGALAIVPLGGLVKKPRAELFTTPWKDGVRLVTIEGRPVRPGDMEPGALQTVFPGVPGGTKAPDAPTMLIRLRPDQTVTRRPGQQDFGWQDYVAYSKICTHAGCPVSLYEQQTSRILCPCHQSQFLVTQDALPVFGPAARPLPSLAITVDGEGYFVARGDYREPIGPSFWERP
jgi:ubiquinol-cytochrome c reductase iron-sulfur subunit